MPVNPIEQMVADRVAADPITAAISDTVQAAVTAALDSHLPRLTRKQSEAAQMLGVSVETVSQMVRDGRLHRLAGPQSPITLGSILVAAGWPMQAAPVAAPLSAVPA